MRLLSFSVAAPTLVLLTACSSSGLGPSSGVPPATGASHLIAGHFMPVWSKYASLIPVELRPGGFEATIHRLAAHPGTKKGKGGIYASEFFGTSIWGYTNPNTHNNPPTCSVGPVDEVEGIAVDGKGYLIDPDGGSRSIIVFTGPGMCGSEFGSFTDNIGQPSDATSADAVHDTIAVGNIFDNSSINNGAGSVAICGFLLGCVRNLTNSNMFEVGGVAMDKKGNCWASAVDPSGTATLTYFSGCSGSGVATTGYKNSYYGGLDIDKAGNLVSISAFNSELYVYKGCNPTCSLVGGPFALEDESIFGHLDKKSKNFAASDFALGQIDVYKYSPTAMSYKYSFNNGLTQKDSVEGVAFNPRSKQ
jgi:hypothetical protein